MKFQYYNPNPLNKCVGDCVIRALTKALDLSWEKAYCDLTAWGYAMADLPSSNAVWDSYLRDKGYKKYNIPDTCPDCYTIEEFVNDHKRGTYILGTGSHVVTVSDGTVFDSWDSSQELPLYYYVKE